MFLKFTIQIIIFQIIAVYVHEINAFYGNQKQKLKKDGTSFIIVGDYGQMIDLDHANLVFNGINSIKQNAR
jgi:predicted AlkP superfamily pyrophosphatase or phosphodiesterase